MAKNTKTNSMSKILKIALLIPLSIVALIALVFAGLAIINPIMDKADQEKFKTLDTQMEIVYNKLKTAADGADIWNHIRVCSDNKSGWMPTGTYNCVNSMSLEKTISSVAELNNLQSKYYPIIENSGVLTTKTQLDPQLMDDFGKKFVVSSAEKIYTESKTKIECKYSIDLFQSTTNLSEPNSYGKDIIDRQGKTIVSLRCDETARKPWYTKVLSTSDLIPDVDPISW